METRSLPPINNYRELMNENARQSNSSVGSSSENRTPLMAVTRNSRPKGDKQGGNRGQGGDSGTPGVGVNPGVVEVQLRSSTNDNTTSPDLENPDSINLVQAEVAADMDAVIQRAVEDALRQRDEQMAAASVVTGAAIGGAPEETNEDGDDAGSNNGNNDGHDKQSFNKKILYAGIGVIVLITVIVVVVTTSGAGSDETSSNLDNSPTLAPVDEVAPSVTSPSTAPKPTLPPTLPTSLSGDCDSASIITAGFSQIISTTSGMDTFVNSQCSVSEGDRGIWLKFVPTFPGIATLSASQQDFNAKLAYFTGTCQLPVCGDRTMLGVYQTTEGILSFNAEVGEEYFLFVGGNGVNNKGTLKLALAAPTPAPSSYCDGAIDVTNTLPYDQRDSSIATVPTALHRECGIDLNDRGNWYKYVPTRDVIITVKFSSQERTTRMAYFSGSSCESLTCGGSTPASMATRSMDFFAQPGNTYYIFVGSDGFQNAGSYRMQIIESIPPESSYFTGATIVTSDYTNPFVMEGTTQFAVPSFSSDECSVKDDSDRGQWFRYTPTVESITTVTLSASFAKRLSMYTANCVGNVCDSLSCAKETGGTALSVASVGVLEFHAKVGTDFFFLVSGSHFDQVGNFNIRFESSEPPANSYCSNAIAFSKFGFDVQSQEGDTAMAVPSFFSDSCDITDDRGLWYKYTPPSDRMVQVLLGEHEWIARLSYYTGSCNNLECGAQTGTSGADSMLRLYARSGVDYYFLISGRGFDQAGPFQITIDPPAAPANSFCEGATEVSTLTLLGTTFAESTTNSVPSFSNADCEIRESDRGVWFKLPSSSASPGEAVTVQVTGQEFDAKLSVFESQDSCSGLSCTISTSWSTSSRSLTWTYAEGRTYYVLVSGDGFLEAGSFSINFVRGFG